MRSTRKTLPLRTERVLSATCLLALALCLSGCAPKPAKTGRRPETPFARRFAMKEIDLLVEQDPGRSRDMLPTRLTLTNVTDQPICLLKVSIPDDAGDLTLHEPETVRASYFYRKGALCLRIEESEMSGDFMRTDAFLLPGQGYAIECPLEDLNRRGRAFLVTYQVMQMRSVEKQVFVPLEEDRDDPDEQGKVYESVSQRRMELLRDADAQLDEVVCARAGKMNGFRCSVGPR